MSSAGKGFTSSRSPLATRIISAAIALALVSTGVIFAARMIFIFFADRIIGRVTHELVATNSLKRQLIETEITERFADATVLAERRITRAAIATDRTATMTPGQRRELTAMAREWRDTYRYRSVTIVDRALKPVATTTESAIPREAMDAMVQVMKSGKPVLIDLFRIDNTKFLYGVTTPIRSSDGSASRTGAVYIEIDADKMLLPLIESWPTASVTSESVIVRRDGDDVLYLGRLRNLPGVAPQTLRRPIREANLLAARALRGEIGMVLNANDYRGVPVVGIATKIADTPWRLISKIDKAEAQADVVLLGRAISVLAILFVVIAASLLYYIRKAQQFAADRRQAKLAEEYSATIEATTDAFLRLDAQGNVLHANSAAERMTGFSRAELEQSNIARLRDDGAPGDIESIHREVQQSGGKRFQTRWRRKDGQVIDLDASVMYINDGGAGYFQGFLRDITEAKEIRRRLERLNRYREFLAYVTPRIFGLRNAPQIVQTVCDSAVEQGGFVLAWAGIVDEAAGRVRIAATAGKAADYVETLVVTLDPELPTSHGPTGTAVREKRTMTVNDFLDDPRTVPWRDRAREYGIRASSAAPIIVEGRAVGALMFYADTKDYFDEEMIGLLEETARNISLAWEAGDAQLARDTERNLRRNIAERYESLFENSPLPSQIHDATTGHLVAINEAHRQAFGYPLEEIAGESAWFEHAYPDPILRQRLRETWLEQIRKARESDRTEESPELSIRCRDGSLRTVREFMTVTGNDAMVGWVDLTEVRRREAELRESEGRFRGMVEQTLAGIYVVRDGHIVYTNPQFAKMIGRAASELLGLDPVGFVEPEDRHKILEGRAALASGAKSVQHISRWKRGDGSTVVLGILATRGDWDGAPAFIVMVEDVTERTRTEDTIRDYLHRLDRSVTGTLQAVAKMVELRDPYTAGHERRVGLIAAAIARKMGWDEQKCRELELIGLVHDIGKISVPAEILSKPSRLSAVEYEMIKGHAEAGYDILKDVQFNQPIAEIVRQHHERMDGSGYPRGLKGDAIAMEARILAVADVLESMASHRPYRAALGLQASMAEIRSNRGKLYDEAVVDAVTRLVEDKGFTLPE